MSQTSYNEQGDAQVGMLSDSSIKVTDSFAAEAAVPYGRLVVRGTNRIKECKLPAASTDITNAKNVLGIAMRTQAIEIPLNSTSDPEYKATNTVSVLNFGRIWVETEDAATDTTKDVYARHAVAGALNKVGSFSTAAGTGLVKLDNAKWISDDKMINNRRMAILEIRL